MPDILEKKESVRIGSHDNLSRKFAQGDLVIKLCVGIFVIGVFVGVLASHLYHFVQDPKESSSIRMIKLPSWYRFAWIRLTVGNPASGYGWPNTRNGFLTTEEIMDVSNDLKLNTWQNPDKELR